MFKLLQDFIQRLAHVLSGTPEEVRRIDALAEDRTINPYYRPMLMMQEFFKFEAGGGLLLMLCAIAALITANSALGPMYENTLHHTKGIIGVGDVVFEKTIIHWINDGLMALFFFLVGLEVKRELGTGMMSTWNQRVLPTLAAFGGIAVPALIYYGIVNILANGDATELTVGWAIPAATDIAFAIGIFALLGQYLPTSLKVFLLALAIIDDIGAVIIIALFYTSDLSQTQLYGAGICLALLILMNIINLRSRIWYVLLGLTMWAFVVKSGVHATLAGIALAFTIPMDKDKDGNSMLTEFEHGLHPFVAFLVLPLFAFANAGVNLEGVTLDKVLSPITLGIVAGLVLGKQLGIFGISWLAIKLRIAKMPIGANFTQLWGVSILAGIGFTMSLFIGTLAFPGTENLFMLETKLGILIGSGLSAIIGLTVLWFSTRTARTAVPKL